MERLSTDCEYRETLCQLQRTIGVLRSKHGLWRDEGTVQEGFDLVGCWSQDRDTMPLAGGEVESSQKLRLAAMTQGSHAPTPIGSLREK